MQETTPTVIKSIMYAVLMFTAPMITAGEAQEHPPLATPHSLATTVSPAESAPTTAPRPLDSPIQLTLEQLDMISSGADIGAKIDVLNHGQIVHVDVDFVPNESTDNATLDVSALNSRIGVSVK